MIDWESVNYWQSIDSPESINATPTYLQADGTLATGTAQAIDNVMGVLFDEEALGLTIINEIMAASPLNPRTLSTNYYWHMVSRTYNDFTENGLVLVADTVTP